MKAEQDKVQTLMGSKFSLNAQLFIHIKNYRLCQGAHSLVLKAGIYNYLNLAAQRREEWVRRGN